MLTIADPNSDAAMNAAQFDLRVVLQQLQGHFATGIGQSVIHLSEAAPMDGPFDRVPVERPRFRGEGEFHGPDLPTFAFNVTGTQTNRIFPCGDLTGRCRGRWCSRNPRPGKSRHFVIMNGAKPSAGQFI